MSPFQAAAPPGVEIALAHEDELAALPAIERAAASAFAPWGLDELFALATTPMPILREALARGELIVARTDRPVGFALLSRVDWHAHLDEIHVAPAHARRGIGTALVAAALELARRADRRRMTLATMRDVPFNGPWYRRLGFRELGFRELGPGLRTLLRRELAGGYPIADRVILGRDL